MLARASTSPSSQPTPSKKLNSKKSLGLLTFFHILKGRTLSDISLVGLMNDSTLVLFAILKNEKKKTLASFLELLLNSRRTCHLTF